MALFGTEKKTKIKTNEVFAYFVITIEKITSILQKYYKIKNISLIKFEVAAFLTYNIFDLRYDSYEMDDAMLLTMIHDHILTFGDYIMDSFDVRVKTYNKILRKSWETKYEKGYNEYEKYLKPIYNKFIGLIVRGLTFDKRLVNDEDEICVGEWEDFIKVKNIDTITTKENDSSLDEKIQQIEKHIRKMLHTIINPFEIETQYKWWGSFGDMNSIYKAY